MTTRIPTAQDVVDFLNLRLAARGLTVRVEQIDVLPYVNPMWLANWAVPQLDGLSPQEVIEEEIREARWQFPQVLE